VQLNVEKCKAINDVFYFYRDLRLPRSGDDVLNQSDYYFYYVARFQLAPIEKIVSVVILSILNYF